jgi:hypothetical protein
LTRLRTRFAAIALAVLVPATVAACGGSSSSSEDPQQALHETFNNPKSITSGKLDLSVSASVEGSQSGSFDASIDGPFQGSADKTQFPQLDLTAKVSGSGAGSPSISFEGGLIATKTAAFVEYQGQAYQVPSALYQRFAAAYQQQANLGQSAQQSSNASSFFKRLGIDPSTWLTNLSNDGDTDVGGVSTIHISGDADVGKIVTDIAKVAKSFPGATAQVPSSAQLKQVEGAVKTAHIDVYTGADDHLLRKLAVSLDIAPPAGSTSSGVSSVSLNFSITLTDVNQQQTITAPSNAKPLSDLTGQLGALGLLGSAGGGGVPGLSGGGSTAGRSSSGVPSSASTQAYLKCAQQAAGDQQKINGCLSKLK